jgi:MerR family transcriptional regulator/heat shock protein HspR
MSAMANDDTGPSTIGTYVISVAADLAGVHPQTLRIYERKGLLEPKRSTGGNRRYSDADIVALRRILELTNAGVNLEGVRRVLALEQKIADLAHALEDAHAAARAAVAQTHRQYRRDLVPIRGAHLPVAVRRPGR